MANKDGYSWECERDGMNVKDIAERPVLGLNKMHTEFHNSETGRESEAPEYAQPETPRRK
jgi:hypothetical protein